jgi:hypothetical protein
VKSTPVEDADHGFLEETIENVSRAIGEIDRQIEEFDEQMRQIDLQGRLSDFEVMAPGRRLYYSGPAMKYSRSSIDPRHIAVFSDVLLVAEEVAFGSLRVNKTYPTGTYLIEGVGDQGPFQHAVDIRESSKSFRIQFPDEKEKGQLLWAWGKVRAEKGLTDDQLSARVYAPVWVPDSLAPECMVCHSPFTLFRRRHHCRSCGSVICSNCGSAKIANASLGPGLHMVCKACAARLESGDSK